MEIVESMHDDKLKEKHLSF